MNEETSKDDPLLEQSVAFIKKVLSSYLSSETKVFLFGSRAQGRGQERSDIDVGIEAEDLSQSKLAEIQHIIDESFVPFKVDVVNFAKIKNEEFKKEALKKVIPWSLD